MTAHVEKDRTGILAGHRSPGRHFRTYAVISASPVQVSSTGRLPMRSDTAPMTGSSTRFDAPTHSVTVSALAAARCRTELPKVGCTQ